MKKKYYGVYQITNHADFSLTFVADGFTSEANAKQTIDSYAGGKFIIIEYYE